MIRAAPVLLALAVAACGAGAPTPVAPSRSTAAPATAVPGPTDVPNPAGTSDAGGPILDPNLDAIPVVPMPGVTNTHPVDAESLAVHADGPHVTATLTWTSGVEPCVALARVDVARGDGEVTLTIVEGNGAGPDVACTAQAVRKSATVDLGELDPGPWLIRATGDAPPVEIESTG